MNRPSASFSPDFARAERLMIDAVTYAVGFGSTVYALRHLSLTDDEWRRIAALDELGDLTRAGHSITHLHRKLGRAA